MRCPALCRAHDLRAAAAARGRRRLRHRRRRGPLRRGVTYRPGARFGPSRDPAGISTAAALQPRPRRRARSQRRRSSTPGTSPQPVRHRPRVSTQIARGRDRAHRRRAARGLPSAATTPSRCPLLRALHAAARPGRPGPLRRPPRHLGHLLRRPLHPRHARSGGPPRRGCSSRATRHTSASAGSLYDRADLLDDAELGFTIVHCRDLDRIGVDGVVERVLDRVGDAPVYVSIDIDVLDPAFAPGDRHPRGRRHDQPRAARRSCAGCAT